MKWFIFKLDDPGGEIIKRISFRDESEPDIKEGMSCFTKNYFRPYSSSLR